jgi:uncharacterized protein YyaL (SSP411 family)
MQEALARYSQAFYNILSEKNRRALFFSEVNKKTYLKSYLERSGLEEKKRALRLAMEWLEVSQKASKDGGFCTFYLKDGWTSSYPETSGYIVPTLLRYGKITGEPKWEEMAFACLDWLLEIQFKDGGWQSGYVHQLRDAVVFNTGQVLRGMLAGASAGSDKYLQAGIRAGDWLVKTQHQDGYWSKHNYLGVARVYDSYVASPLLHLWLITQKSEYKDAAIRNLNWILENKQQPNGWFQDCDNTLHRNHQPIIHTIGYTIQGLIESFEILGDEKYLAAAAIPAEKLASLFAEKGILAGRYDANWQGYDAFITTGGAQLAIAWQALHHHTDANLFADAAIKMTRLLTVIQDRAVPEQPETKGALFGSFPFWGRYEGFGCPNWGTKYFADALLNEIYRYERGAND